MSLVKISVKSFFVIFVLNVFVGLASAQGFSSSIAIISGERERAVDSLFIAQLEVRLSQLSNIRLLERTFIQDILEEHRLRASGITTDAKNTVQLGQLLSADILLFAERIPNDEILIYRMKIVESKTGIVLLSWLTQNEIRSEDIERIVKSVTLAASKKQMDETNGHYIGILQIRSEELGTALDGISQALKAFLAEDLASTPNVVILDREHLQYLQQEKTLTGLELKLKSSAVIIEGGIKYGPDQHFINVTLILRYLDSTKKEETLSFQIPASDMNIETGRGILAKKILDKLKIKSSPTQLRNPQKEAGLFMRQVSLFLASGEYDEAIRNAEVALALNPSQETRYWAARAWYALSRSIRTNPSFVTRNIPRRNRAGAASNLRQQSDGNISNRKVNEELTRDRRQNDRRVIERSRGAHKIDSAQLQRILSASLRAYTLIEEITRKHILKPQGFVIPDPLEGLSTYDTKTRSRNNPSLKNILIGQESQNQRLFKQLCDLSKIYINKQRVYYREHYDQSRDVQTAYWATWQKEKEFISDYYGYNSHSMTRMFAMAFDAFTGVAQEKFEPRIKGITNVSALSNKTGLSSQEMRLYQSLQIQSDPFVQLIVNKQLLRNNPLLSSQNMIRIFAENFVDNPDIWNMEDVKFIPNLLRSAIHRLAISDRETLIQYGGAIFKIILKDKNVRHLVAWQARDVFWPYVNSLVLNHQEKEARFIIDQAIALLENSHVIEKSKEAKILHRQLNLKLVQLDGNGSLDQDSITDSVYIMKASDFRLRSELEPPLLGEPIDISIFPDAPKSPHGFTTSTVSRSSSRFGDNEGGDVYNFEYTRIIDVEGNEQYKIVKIDVAVERAKDRGQAVSAWDQYNIQRMSTRVSAIASPAHRSRTWKTATVTRNQLIDGKKAYVIKEKRQNNNLIVTVFEHDLFNAQANRKLGTATVPIIDQQTFFVTALSSDDNHIYVGTSGGLLIFKKGSGDIIEKVEHYSYQNESRDLVNQDQSKEKSSGKVRHLHEKNGFPDNRILSLAYFDNKLYVGIGPLNDPQGGLVGDCGFVAYDPQTEKYELLASSRSLKKHNPLEGGNIYQINTILVDSQNAVLWLAINGNSDLNGIWKFDIATRQFYHQVKEDLTIQEMKWADKKILYAMYGSGLTLFDPQTQKKTWLLGYIVSAYSGPSRPVPPKGLQDDPLYGYPKTRLWPFAMKDNDLFTLGWEGRNVLLHQKGGESFEKSMLNPSSNVVTGKRYLSVNEHGVWVITDFGQVYWIRSKKVGP